MKQTAVSIILLSVAADFAVSVQSGAHEEAHKGTDKKRATAAKISKDELAGKLFERPDMEKETEDGNTTLDVTNFMSSDEKFGSGMYKSGKVRDVITEPWGVDEFIYILEGSITMTSKDGTVQVINAGEAVTVPKEWTGVLDTEGFTQIWVSYDESGLE